MFQILFSKQELQKWSSIGGDNSSHFADFAWNVFVFYMWSLNKCCCNCFVFCIWSNRIYMIVLASALSDITSLLLRCLRNQRCSCSWSCSWLCGSPVSVIVIVMFYCYCYQWNLRCCQASVLGGRGGQRLLWLRDLSQPLFKCSLNKNNNFGFHHIQLKNVVFFGWALWNVFKWGQFLFLHFNKPL